MGILSTLLTGVSLVGKVCQGLSGAFGSNRCLVYKDGNSETYDSDVTVGGATFYVSNEGSPTGDFSQYVHNPTSLPLSVTVPNINNQGGMEILVAPKKSRDLSLMLDGSIPPDTEMMAGPISASDVDDEKAGIYDAAVKININHLPLSGGAVRIGGITLKANAKMNSLVVNSTDSAIGSITYFNAISDKGITGEYLDTIIPEQTNVPLTIGVERTYVIPFGEMGFNAADSLNCRIYFSTAAGNKERLLAHEQKCVAPPKGYEEYLLAKKRK